MDPEVPQKQSEWRPKFEHRAEIPLDNILDGARFGSSEIGPSPHIRAASTEQAARILRELRAGKSDRLSDEWARALDQADLIETISAERFEAMKRDSRDPKGASIEYERLTQNREDASTRLAALQGQAESFWTKLGWKIESAFGGHAEMMNQILRREERDRIVKIEERLAKLKPESEHVEVCRRQVRQFSKTPDGFSRVTDAGESLLAKLEKHPAAFEGMTWSETHATIKRLDELVSKWRAASELRTRGVEEKVIAFLAFNTDLAVALPLFDTAKKESGMTDLAAARLAEYSARSGFQIEKLIEDQRKAAAKCRGIDNAGAAALSIAGYESGIGPGKIIAMYNTAFEVTSLCNEAATKLALAAALSDKPIQAYVYSWREAYSADSVSSPSAAKLAVAAVDADRYVNHYVTHFKQAYRKEGLGTSSAAALAIFGVSTSNIFYPSLLENWKNCHEAGIPDRAAAEVAIKASKEGMPIQRAIGLHQSLVEEKGINASTAGILLSHL